jgi:aspartate dehydrogenase
MPYTVAIAGIGAIGMKLARTLDAGEIADMRLTAVSARNHDSARERVSDFADPPMIVDAADLARHADIIVECAPKDVFEQLARSAIRAGRIFMPLSVGALLDRMDLVDEAARTGARIIVPTGALIGLDAVRAMAVGTINAVTLETRKAPRGLAGAPYLEENNISLEGISEPTLVFSGNALDAARGFPANVNVAAALSLAGIGPAATTVEIWADPSVDRNIQSIRVSSDAADAEMTIRNIPTDENPRTGRVTAQSVIACLKRMTDTLVAGS